MRLVIAAALAAAIASPALAQGAPAAAGGQYQNTVGAPQKATTWTPPAPAPTPAPAAAPAQQPVIKKRPPCGSVPPKAAATPMGGGTVFRPIRC